MIDDDDDEEGEDEDEDEDDGDDVENNGDGDSADGTSNDKHGEDGIITTYTITSTVSSTTVIVSTIDITASSASIISFHIMIPSAAKQQWSGGTGGGPIPLTPTCWCLC